MNSDSRRPLIDEFVQQFIDVADIGNDTVGLAGRLDRSQIRALLESLLRKLNVVTREEFDAQAAVLTRTRKKLQNVEALLADIEDKINQ